jgi:hypothetical protein
MLAAVAHRTEEIVAELHAWRLICGPRVRQPGCLSNAGELKVGTVEIQVHVRPEAAERRTPERRVHQVERQERDGQHEQESPDFGGSIDQPVDHEG